MTKSEDRIPRRITLVVCPACGRMGLSNVDLRPGHFYRGARCEGTPRNVMYLREVPNPPKGDS